MGQSQKNELVNAKLKDCLICIIFIYRQLKLNSKNTRVTAQSIIINKRQDSKDDTSYQAPLHFCTLGNVSGHLQLDSFPSPGPSISLAPSLSSSLTINHNLVVSTSSAKQTHTYTLSLSLQKSLHLVIKKDFGTNLVHHPHVINEETGTDND